MLIETFIQDIRIGHRAFAREKSFSVLAVLILAIGICAFTTQFAIVNGVLLRGLRFHEADRLVDVQLSDPTEPLAVSFSPASFNSRVTLADFTDLKNRQSSFSDFAGYVNGATVNFTWRDRPVRAMGAYVTHDFFRTLGVSPVLGRDFLPEEDRPNVPKGVLLSDALWRSDFGASPGVIGQAIRVNGGAGIIVGVMPPKFAFPTQERLWIPVRAEFADKPRHDPGVNYIAVIARLKPGVSAEQAAAEMSALAQDLAAAYPDTNKQLTSSSVRPLIAVFTGGSLRGLLYTLLAFCSGVLLIACVNVMNMQFVRAALRARELAIRASLGATSQRLIRQLLTESMLVAACGAAIGTGLAIWSTDFLAWLFADLPNALPPWMTFDLDLRVLGFVVGVTMVSALISGLAPAWFSSSARAIDALKEGGRGNTGGAIGGVTRTFVVFQIAVTSVLLIGALLLLQSMVKQRSVDYGYDTDAILSARLGLMEGDYPTAAKRRQAYEGILRELRAAARFEAVALTNRFRMVYSGSSPIEIEGREYAVDSPRPAAEFENISPGYRAVLGQKILAGRELAEEDSELKQPVAVVNATFAKKHFGRASALQRRFRTTQPNGTQPGPWRTIVGVVTDLRMQDPFNAQSDGAGFYVPFFDTAAGPIAPTPMVQKFATVIARPRGPQRPAALAPALQSIVNKVDPNLPLYSVGTPRTFLDGFLGQSRIVAGMFTVFGAVAVLLASVGLYGVMSFSVNERRQEFGVRLALGAEPASVLRLAMRRGAWQIGVGLALGLGLALFAATLGLQEITGFLFQTDPRNPPTYAAVAGLLAAVSLVAIYIPARRAARADPLIALRAE